MSTKQIIGLLILSLPFIAMSFLMVMKDGWRTFFAVWGFVLLTVSIGYVGVWLITSK